MWDIWREEAYVWRTWPSLARPMFILCASWGVRLKMTNCMFCELTAWMMHYYHKKQNCCCRSTLSMFAVTGSAVGTACKTTACVVLSSNNYVALVHCHNNEPTIHVIYYHIPLCFICGRLVCLLLQLLCILRMCAQALVYFSAVTGASFITDFVYI